MTGRDRGKYAVHAAIVVVSTLAIVGGLVYRGGSDPAERHVAGAWGPIAFALPVAAPAVLAFLGWRERPWLLVAAGIVLVPMTMMSFSYLFALLLPSACVCLGVAVTRPRLAVHPRGQPFAALLCVGFVVGAVLNLFASGEPRTVTSGTSTWTGDVVTRHGALTTIAFVVAAVAIGALAPKDRCRAER